MLVGCTPATPTPTATATTAASATATWTPSVTPTPSPSPTPTFPADAIVAAEGLNLRAGPNTLHPIRELLRRGTPVALLGRSHDDAWLSVRSPAESTGWLSAEFLELRRDLQTVPTQPTPTSPPTPTPTPIPMDPAQPLVLVPPAVAQGEPLLVRLREPNAERVVALLDQQELALQRVDDQTWAGVLAAPADISPGQQPVFLTIIRPGGETVPLNAMLTLHSGGYAEETINLDLAETPERAAWIDPAVRNGELERLRALSATVSPEKLWSGVWRAPVTVTVSSAFGTFRDYNDGSYAGRHSGLDLRAASGTPILAAARGRVVAAEAFAVLGNAVWLDHGWGVHSGYGHLSQILVQPGAIVERGAIIGLAGATGAVTGPHLHWEVRVAGIPVHPARWLERDLATLP
jgi:murein DD-endopeptidase MepM/ murein hydrolase activator NlpD